ncbi:cation transporter, partial [Marinobacter sp.]
MTELAPTPVRLSISGASCQGCARKIRAALAELAGNEEAIDIDLDQQTVTLPPDTDADEAARRVSEAGYPAEVMAADSCPLPANGPAPAAPIASTSASGPQVQLAVTGATCASCVRTIEGALMSVPGSQGAHMNLADNTATVFGNADTPALIAAVESAGYGAREIEDPDTIDERKQQEDQRHYRELLIKMAISLGLGLGLMIWGMGFGDMMVTASNQSTWLALGGLTLVVMLATGGHYFTGAWKAFLHHNA